MIFFKNNTIILVELHSDFHYTSEKKTAKIAENVSINVSLILAKHLSL